MERNGGKVPKIEYESVLGALRGAADKYGDGAYFRVSLPFPKDEWQIVDEYLTKHTKRELVEELLCRLAEVK